VECCRPVVMWPKAAVRRRAICSASGPMPAWDSISEVVMSIYFPAFANTHFTYQETDGRDLGGWLHTKTVHLPCLQTHPITN